MRGLFMSKEQQGVTLVELMVVLGCLAILAAIAVPTWISSARPAYRLKNAAHQVITDVRYARMRAIATNREYRLRFDPSSDSYRMERGDLASGSFSWTAEGTRRHFGSGAGPSFSGIQITGEKEYSIVFRPTGTVSSATVTLKNTLKRTVKIVCSMAGRIRLVRG